MPFSSLERILQRKKCRGEIWLDPGYCPNKEIHWVLLHEPLNGRQQKIFPSTDCLWTQSKSIPAFHEFYCCWSNPLQTCGIYQWCSFYLKNDLLLSTWQVNYSQTEGKPMGHRRPKERCEKNLPLFQKHCVRPGKRCWYAHRITLLPPVPSIDSMGCSLRIAD